MVTKKVHTARVARHSESAPRTRTRGRRPSRLARTNPEPEVSLESATNAELWALLAKERRTSDANPRSEVRIRNLLVERHLPIVRAVSERLMRNLPRHVELDSLMSAGVLGLMDAIRGFDPARNVLFKTYAMQRVRGSIIDMLRSEDWVPRLVRTRATQIERALTKFSADYGREPTQAELAAELNLEPQELDKHLHGAQVQRVISYLDVDDDDEMDTRERCPYADPRAQTPDEIVHAKQGFSTLLRSFSPRERFILEQYYEVGHTMVAIGEMLGVTESRVCQIHRNLLDRLRSLATSEQRDGNL